MPLSIDRGIVVCELYMSQGRQPHSMFPPTLEALFLKNKIVEVKVARLNLKVPGFIEPAPLNSGRPDCDPADLLSFTCMATSSVFALIVGCMGNAGAIAKPYDF